MPKIPLVKDRTGIWTSVDLIQNPCSLPSHYSAFSNILKGWMSSLGICRFPHHCGFVYALSSLHPKCLPSKRKADTKISRLEAQTLEIVQPVSLGYKGGPVTVCSSPVFSLYSLQGHLWSQTERGCLESSPCFYLSWARTLLWARWGLKNLISSLRNNSALDSVILVWLIIFTSQF